MKTILYWTVDTEQLRKPTEANVARTTFFTINSIYHTFATTFKKTE